MVEEGRKLRLPSCPDIDSSRALLNTLALEEHSLLSTLIPYSLENLVVKRVLVVERWFSTQRPRHVQASNTHAHEAKARSLRLKAAPEPNEFKICAGVRVV